MLGDFFPGIKFICVDQLHFVSFVPNLKSLTSCYSICRSPGTPLVDSAVSDALPEPPPPMTNIGTLVESNPESVSSYTDPLTDNITPDSRALVVVPAMSMEALAVVPPNPKNRKSSELVQRRTRRPFSVSEVEALVQAVEELGTGRYVLYS